MVELYILLFKESNRNLDCGASNDETSLTCEVS